MLHITTIFTSLLVVNLCVLSFGQITTTVTPPTATLPTVTIKSTVISPESPLITPSPTNGIGQLSPPEPPQAPLSPTPVPGVPVIFVQSNNPSSQSLQLQQQSIGSSSDLNPSESKTKRSYNPIKNYNDNDDHYREVANDIIEENFLVKHENNVGNLDRNGNNGLLNDGRLGLAAYDHGKHALAEATGIAHLDQKIHKDHDKYIKHTWNRGDGFVKRWSWDQGAHFEKEKDEGEKKHIEDHGKKVHQEHHEIDQAQAAEAARLRDSHLRGSGSGHHSGNQRDSGSFLQDYNYRDNYQGQRQDDKRRGAGQPQKYKDYHFNDGSYSSPYDFVNENYKMSKTGSPPSPPSPPLPPPPPPPARNDRNNGYREGRQSRRRYESSPTRPAPPSTPLEENFNKNFQQIAHHENNGVNGDNYADEQAKHSGPVNPHEGTDSFYFSQPDNSRDEMPAHFGYISSKQPREDDSRPVDPSSEFRESYSSHSSPNSHRDYHRTTSNRSPAKRYNKHHSKEVNDDWKSISRKDQQANHNHGHKNVNNNGKKQKPYRHERTVKYVDEYDNDLHPDMAPPAEPKYTDHPYPAEDEGYKSNYNDNDHPKHVEIKQGKPSGRKTVHHRHERRERKYYIDDAHRSPANYQEESRNHMLIHGNQNNGTDLIKQLTPRQFQSVLDNEFSRTGHLGMGHLFGYASEIPPVSKFINIKKQ